VADELTSEQIAAAAANPASVTAPDGRSAASHPLSDLIETDRYLAQKNASAVTSSETGKRASGFSMVRWAKAVPPGAT
jgi:hypothetical protein